MAPSTTKIVIRSEAVAFDALQAALRDEFRNRQVELSFKDWPLLTLKLSGDGYESSITPEVAQALVELQHALNRAYARAVHHATNARALSAEERREINLKAKVSKGSSVVTVNLGEYAEKLATALAGKMTSDAIVITVLGIAAIAGSVVAAKAWMNMRGRVSELEAESTRAIALSQEETKRHSILAQALARPSQEQLQFAQQDFNDVKRELLRSAGDADNISLQGVVLSNAEARALASTPRSQADDVQLNGHYTIQKIDVTNSDLYRITVVSADGFGTFVATVRPEALSKDQRDRLNTGTWERQRLYMAINANRLRGEITTAAIAAIEWPRKRNDPSAPA